VALKWGYDELRTLIALPDDTARKSLRKTMVTEGMLHCREVGELPVLVEKIQQSAPDLLITTINPQWDTAELIRKVRHHALGANPFMVIIVLLEKPDPAVVNKVVNAGADDLLLPPWLGRLVIDRLDNFAQGRKPFLVTHDYIGPERRSMPRQDNGAVSPTMEVPNPVQWLSEGNADRDLFRKKIHAALEQVNLRKIKSAGGQLRYLADRIVEQFVEGGQAAIQPNLQAMLDAADEMGRRAANTDFAPALELTSGLREICLRLQNRERAPKTDEVAVLPALADAVIKAIYWNDKEPLPQVAAGK
jgi:DNA-binding NarL/FixJ family response regulator